MATIREHIEEAYPELITDSGRFQEHMIFDIGFINPHIENYQGEGIANDETQLEADNLDDLEEVYEGFCNENDFPVDTVTYAEVVHEYDEESIIPVPIPVKSCVVIKHSFDGDTPVYEYDTEEEAVTALKRLYNKYLDEEERNNSSLCESECRCEDDYALITWMDGCKTEFILSYISREV